MRGRIEDLRRAYHRRLCQDVLRLSASGVPNNSDKGRSASRRIGKAIVDRLDIKPKIGKLAGQTAGSGFEEATRDFLRDAFSCFLTCARESWEFALGGNIGNYERYMHLSDVSRITEEHKELKVVFGDYIVKPDIVVCRKPVSNETINENETLLGDDNMAVLTPIRRVNSQVNILHASVSCKWTIRSDRSQNARTEGLNLVRNRKGKTPHIVVVVGEPLPGRIVSLAYGTGDIDCVYHFALQELTETASDSDSDSDLLETMVAGRRLRDISDLPFDLAI